MRCAQEPSDRNRLAARDKLMSTKRVKIVECGLSVPPITSPVPIATALPARRNDAKIFLREFTRELIREISPAAKILSLLGVALLVGGLFYAGRAALVRYRVQNQKLSQTEILTRRVDEQEKLLGQLSEKQGQQPAVITTRSDRTQIDRFVPINLSLPTQLWNLFSNGTCLIAGSYIFIDQATGRPLRHPEVGLSPEERLLTIGTQVPLTPEGNGTIFEMEFVGTGFHVGNGYVLTNRHIASQPWAVDKRAQFFAASTGANPRMEKLLAFFPGHRQPIALKFRAASASEDVAVCTLSTIPSDIPVLPLDRQLVATEIGRAVVMMGYPTGPNRLLALLPEPEALAVENEYGGALVTLLDQLAKRKLVKPLTTQGHITDLYKNRIVFDAATTEGSSGTPMFGESGKVIGITFAVFVDDGASNFAVPIAVGLEVLKKAGWKPQRNE
jgi:S1-C subfamily serine protease